MLRLAGTTAIPPAERFQFMYGFWIWWDSLRDSSPHSWWSIDAPGHYLMVELHTPSGTLTSIECPISQTVRKATDSIWRPHDAAVGHPVFEHTLPPWKKHSEPDLEQFVFEYSPIDIKLHWGSEVRALRSGRCMFGFNANDELVSVGVTHMNTAEYGRVRLSRGEATSDVPASRLHDWQLDALLDVMREQLASPWVPEPSPRDPAFVALTDRVNEIEREIERRRGPR